MAFTKLKQFWSNLRSRADDNMAEWRDDMRSSRGIKIGFAALALYFLIALVVGIYWSWEPPMFAVKDNAAAMAESHGQEMVTGSATTATLIKVASTLLDKPGGFLKNDKFPPGVWLDNMPSWEFGALRQVRDLSKAMRDNFSRSQSQSSEDPDLAIAEPRFNVDADNWVLPAAESEYREGIEHLESYLMRLGDVNQPDAQFYSRADNLSEWLRTVEARLGDLSQRLSQSTGQRQLNIDLAGEPDAKGATAKPADEFVKTDWNKIDDVLYEARGTTWALIHFLRAVEVDFADVLKKKNALVSLQQIIRELEATQHTIWSPVVLNGSGFGIWANHSLVMASYISRANAAIIDLRELLARG